MIINTKNLFDLQTLNKELNELMNQQISEQYKKVLHALLGGYIVTL